MATLKEIQNCELEILKEIAAILDKNNIDYWLAYGTMLGAVRHNGFIPWDDDIDINIRFSDLREIKRIMKKELPDSYFFQTIESEETYFCIYPKIRKNGTSMVRENLPYKNNGLWIDIFPLMSASRNKSLLKIQVSIMRIIQNNRMHLIYNRSNKGVKDFFKWINNKAIAISEKYFLLPIVCLLGIGGDRFIEIGNRFYKNVSVERPLKKLIDKSLFDERCEYDFEGYKFYGVKDYDFYLSFNYGKDYMTPLVTHMHTENYDDVIV